MRDSWVILTDPRRPRKIRGCAVVLAALNYVYMGMNLVRREALVHRKIRCKN